MLRVGRKTAQFYGGLTLRRMFHVPAKVQPTPIDFGVFKAYQDGKILWLVMDRPNKSENAIGSDFQDSILKAADHIEKLAHAGQIKICILTSAKKRFCVGADIPEVYACVDPNVIKKTLIDGRKAMKRLTSLPVPTLAAINGDALGGGLEIALACDYRVCAASDKHKLGLPEVMLGVIPGLGGTVRMPKLVGLQNALTYILQGTQLKPSKARKAGLVDALVEDGDRYEGENRFLVGVKNYAKQVEEKGKKRKPKALSWLDWFLAKTPVGRYVVTNTTMKKLDGMVKGKYPAPYKAFASVMNSVKETNEDKALEFEGERFAELCVSATSKNLMSLFFLTDNCKKLSSQAVHFGENDAIKVNKIAVLGAGVMGSGIAHWASKNKLACFLKDISDDAVAKGLKFVQEEFGKGLKKKKLTQAQYKQLVGRVTGSTSNSGLKDIPVIIEAAVEVMDIKKKMIAELEKDGILDKNVIFATNTSALSVNELANSAKYPENVVGMHFFNPVSKMPLVEVIKGDKTSKKAIATVYKLALDMGKFPIVVKDGPGFLVNRVLGLYMSEAGRMITEGGDPAKIDKIILDFGMPMGPYRLLDEVGIDVAAHVGPTLKSGLGDRFADNPKLHDMIKQGHLGKKSNKGFYKYNEKGKETEIDVQFLTSLAVVEPKSTFNYDDVVDRCILSMVNEASLILAEGIAATAEDVDLGMVFGTGFAPFRGGLLSYADSRGVANVVESLQKLATRYGDRFKPSDYLVKMAAENKRFFPNRPFLPMKEGREPHPKIAFF